MLPSPHHGDRPMTIIKFWRRSTFVWGQMCEFRALWRIAPIANPPRFVVLTCLPLFCIRVRPMLYAVQCLLLAR